MTDSSSELDEATVDGGTPVEGAAESSTANGAEPKSMLDAVKSALHPADTDAGTQVQDSPPEGDTGTDKATEPPAAEGQQATEPEKLDDYADVPFHKHPRFQRLIKERNQFHQQLQEKDTELAQLREETGPQQETLQRFTAFAEQVRGSGLNAQEVNDGFAIMAAMKHNPEQALTMLRPYIDALAIATGHALDDDLQKKVNDGLVDAETATQLQRERHTRLRLEQQTGRQQQAFQSMEQQRATDSLVQSVTAAVTAWEDRQKQSPDYQKKQPLVIREINWLMQQEGYPQTPEAAVAMAEKAKKTVETNLQSLMPRKQEVRTVTGGASAVSAAARPKSLLEAAKLAVRGEYHPA